MASKTIFTLIAVVGIGAASGAAWWYQNKSSSAAVRTDQAAAGAASAPAAGQGRPAVEAVQVQLMKLTDDVQAVGSLRSRQSVVLRPEVSGRITQINFTDGERVRRGQMLVQFDDQLPLAQVQQSQAELSIAMANHKRNQELVAQNFISQRSVDESAANLEVAQAKLALSRATAARLRIVAPFDGIAGIRTVNIGDYLKDGADIVNIEDLEAIFVDFRLPERYQTKIRRGQRASVDLDALPGRSFVAIIQAIDPLIDTNGRSVGVRGCIDNRQLQLRPGMFARVNTVFSERSDALVVPEEAIVPQGGRQFVIKLNEDGAQGGSVTQRVEVKVGIRRPGRVEIVQGLVAGDRVVTAGQQRIQRDGTQVRVMEASAVRAAPGGQGAAGPATAGGGARAGAADAAPGRSPLVAPAPRLPANLAAPRTVSGPNPCMIANAESARPPAPGRALPSSSSAPAGAAQRNPA
ncbi:MAG: efflux RND transporter periplasmic adaptor subunit [Burkholderiaceae bacterium]|nr:efflux RND transporter periplasmic adaptor subunit [Burkholderiaceae bacterium]MDO9088550.1 efflux RND transporter periplasmic adaptor subunit [Burkholderiaceae bacterium]